MKNSPICGSCLSTSPDIIGNIGILDRDDVAAGGINVFKDFFRFVLLEFALGDVLIESSGSLITKKTHNYSYKTYKKPTIPNKSKLNNHNKSLNYLPTLTTTTTKSD